LLRSYSPTLIKITNPWREKVKTNKKVLAKFMKDLLKIFAFVTVVAGLILFVIEENIKSIEVEKEIKSITREIIKINEENRKIVFQLESIRDPNKIKIMAKNKLNMIDSYYNNFVYLDNTINNNNIENIKRY